MHLSLLFRFSGALALNVMLFGLTASSLPAQGEPAKLFGVVFGPRGNPIEQAQVFLDDTELVALTDADGFFSIAGIPPGPHKLTFTKRGYAARAFGFTLPDNATSDIDMGAILLEPIQESLTRVTGTVVDSMTVEPVPAARVMLDKQGVGMSGPEGQFEVPGVPAGFHTLEIRRIGYAPTFVDFEIPVGQPFVSLIVKMRALPAQLAEVTVEGERTIYAAGKLREFYERAESGFGHFITRAEIEKRSARVTTDLLYGVPGLQVTPGQLGGNYVRLARVTSGCRGPVIFLDGARISGSSVDDVVNPEEVAGIEVYTRASDVPPVFNIQGAGACGVIAVWTR